MLRTTHTSTVTEDQIDHLGHMNVRFYGVNAQAGTRAVLGGLPGWTGRPYLVHDTYTRHHREQLFGTTLDAFGTSTAWTEQNGKAIAAASGAAPNSFNTGVIVCSSK